MDTQNKKLPQRKLGNETVSALGIGLMGMHAFYTHNDDPAEAEKRHIEILNRAADDGVTFWDTSDVYGPHTNEEFIGRWFKQTGRRKEIFLCTKFAIFWDAAKNDLGVRNDKEYIRECVEGSLKRLQTDYIDLYYVHRIDKNVRIEDTISALVELVKEGKIRHIGLSECSARTLRRAHAVHPIAAVQMEYSLFCLDIEHPDIAVKKACDELGVAIVAYSPLGRGLLTGQYKSRSDFDSKDWRLSLPRFSEENFGKNLELVNNIEKLAQKKGCSPGQLAIAWLFKQGENVIPIPGSRQMKHYEDNLGSLKVQLSDEEVKEIREETEKCEVKGERYSPSMAALLFADTI